MKLTTSQSAELHIAVSGVLSLLSGVATATYQTATSNHLNVAQIFAFAIGTFTLFGGASFISIMHAMQSSPAAQQAEQDTANQITAWLEDRFASLEGKVLAWAKSTGAPAPQPIVLPSGASPVPARASAPQPAPATEQG